MEEGLLTGDLNVEVGISFVEVLKGDAGDGARGAGAVEVDARLLEGRMREKDEDAGGRGHEVLNHQASSCAASVAIRPQGTERPCGGRKEIGSIKAVES